MYVKLIAENVEKISNGQTNVRSTRLCLHNSLHLIIIYHLSFPVMIKPFCSPESIVCMTLDYRGDRNLCTDCNQVKDSKYKI